MCTFADWYEESAEISGISLCDCTFLELCGQVIVFGSGRRHDRHVGNRGSSLREHFRNRFGAMPSPSGVVCQFLSRTKHCQKDKHRPQEQHRVCKSRQGHQRRTQICHSISINNSTFLTHGAVSHAALSGQTYHLDQDRISS